METKVCGGTGYTVEDFRMTLGRRDMWIGVPVRCYMECNKTLPDYSVLITAFTFPTSKTYGYESYSTNMTTRSQDISDITVPWI